MAEATQGRIAEKRSLTPQERELTRWLLEHSESTEFLTQIDKLTVVSKCNCGCATIDFAVDGREPQREREVILADYLATVDTHPIGDILFKRGGILVSLHL